MEIKLDKNQKAGIIGSALAVLLILVILFAFTLKPPFPPPPQLGVEVNLGNSEVGGGDIQPIVPKETNQSSSQQSSDISEKEIATQDTEESISINNDNNKTNKKSNVVEEKVPEIDDRLTFKKNNSGGSEGNDNESGDKGQIGGSADAINYTGGRGGNGITYSLLGREPKSIPTPREDHKEEGKVVVKIWVNRDGDVTKAEIRMTGTTTTSSDLHNKAIQAARKAKFDIKRDAAENQVGTITYNFKLENRN